MTPVAPDIAEFIKLLRGLEQHGIRLHEEASKKNIGWGYKTGFEFQQKRADQAEKLLDEERIKHAQTIKALENRITSLSEELQKSQIFTWSLERYNKSKHSKLLELARLLGVPETEDLSSLVKAVEKLNEEACKHENLVAHWKMCHDREEKRANVLAEQLNSIHDGTWMTKARAEFRSEAEALANESTRGLREEVLQLKGEIERSRALDQKLSRVIDGIPDANGDPHYMILERIEKERQSLRTEVKHQNWLLESARKTIHELRVENSDNRQDENLLKAQREASIANSCIKSLQVQADDLRKQLEEKDRELGNWKADALESKFYRDILDQIAKHFGDAAYMFDDGTKSDTPFRAKIPKLVQGLFKDLEMAHTIFLEMKKSININVSNSYMQRMIDRVINLLPGKTPNPGVACKVGLDEGIPKAPVN